MKHIVILGAGTAGTMMANHLKHELNLHEWDISIIDERKEHHYQPGYLFLPFDINSREDIIKSITEIIPKGVNFINESIDKVVAEINTVLLTNGTAIPYDILIIATGAKVAPEETTGMKGPDWHRSVFDFYTFEGALALRNKLRDWTGGNLVVHITEMPINCPVAPLEFAVMADSYFKHKNMRDKVNITFVTPLSGAFTKPKSTEALQHLLDEKHISIVSDFAIQEVDNENNKIIDYSGKEVPFDV
jgi:sulfide:quinone oxidoreductase